MTGDPRFDPQASRTLYSMIMEFRPFPDEQFGLAPRTFRQRLVDYVADRISIISFTLGILLVSALLLWPKLFDDSAPRDSDVSVYQQRLPVDENGAEVQEPGVQELGELVPDLEAIPSRLDH